MAALDENLVAYPTRSPRTWHNSPSPGQDSSWFLFVSSVIQKASASQAWCCRPIHQRKWRPKYCKSVQGLLNSYQGWSPTPGPQSSSLQVWVRRSVLPWYPVELETELWAWWMLTSHFANWATPPVMNGFEEPFYPSVLAWVTKKR